MYGMSFMLPNDLMLTWSAFTKIADTMVMLPMAVFCLLWLLKSDEKRLGISWCLLICAGLGALALSKIVFFR
jgi:hypothetical protein